MWEETLGPIRLLVEHRRQEGDGGPTLRVRSADGDGREWLRFDCFERGPHFHVDPDGRDEITRLNPVDDPVAFALGELERDLEGVLKQAGLELDRPIERTSLAELLRQAEEEMRNPPVDLDAPDVEDLRRRRGEKWQHYPADTLPAWVADMDYPVAEPIRLALARAIERSDLGYSIDPRRTGLPEAFAERMKTRYGWAVDPERIELITDVVQGIYVALEVYSEPRNGVVIQTPIYPPFLESVKEMQRRPVTNPLVQGSDRYELDVDGLRRAVDPSTRIFLLCNPHNPSGRVFTLAELEAIAEVAIANDLVVVSDEIHQDLTFQGQEHIPFATLGPEVEARTVTLTSATKAFSIAGLRCAVAVFGSPALQERFRSVPRHILGGLNSMGIEATLVAWRHAQPWLDRVMSRLETNRDDVAGFVQKNWPSVIHFPPEATYLSWLDFRPLDLPGGPARFFFENARVVLSNGKFFGEEGRGFVRLNFATPRPILDEVLRRMADALERKGP